MPNVKRYQLRPIGSLIAVAFGTSLMICDYGIAQDKRVVPTVTEKALINDVKATVDQREIVAASVEADREKQELYDKFQKLLTGAKLTGKFTVDGKSKDKLSEETYEISKVKKLPEGDKWEITARIVYGNNDYEMPVPIDVKWAGKTPVLVLENMLTPFGTFGARVVFHKDKYAGTWSHDDVGGHMFGTIKFGEEANAGKN